MKPTTCPARPLFSSGPCAKRPGWAPQILNDALIGRSHRSKPGKAKLAAALSGTRNILGIPDQYHIAIVPASDTGAVELALWNLLGPRPVDMLAWESFGAGWITDVVKQLRLQDVRTMTADYGRIVDLAAVNPGHDVVFTWNGTTSGVRVPDGDWIRDDRQGLTICDATSAAFAQYLPWDKLDVTTFSWQKVLGGEAAHGILILSPRAVARLESYSPPWPLPKIFRIKKKGTLDAAIFEGATINTPSMLCVEDYLDALQWAENIGGLEALIKRADDNTALIEDWVARTGWVDFLAEDPATRSNTSVCLKIVDPWFLALPADARASVPRQMAALLDEEGAAYDIEGYRDAPPGLRIWCGATVESSDIKALLPWLDWAYMTVKTRADA